MIALIGKTFNENKYCTYCEEIYVCIYFVIICFRKKTMFQSDPGIEHATLTGVDPLGHTEWGQKLILYVYDMTYELALQLAVIQINMLRQSLYRIYGELLMT